MKNITNKATTFLLLVFIGFNLNAIPTVDAQLNAGSLPPIVSLVLSERPAAIVAFAWAEELTATSYTPTYSYNLTGGAITAVKVGTGAYTMTFDGLSLSRGNVQVSAYSDNRKCDISNGWSGTSANVRCYDSSGSLADSQYTISVIQDSISAPNLAESDAFITGYLWADDSSSASYTPDEFYSYNSTGGANTVDKNATGDYSVIMQGVNISEDSNVIVSAYGSNANCISNGWLDLLGTGIFGVLCVDPIGVSVDSLFTILVTEADGRAKTGKAKVVAYAWATNSDTVDYLAEKEYSYVLDTNANINLFRYDTGRYKVEFNKTLDNSLNGGNVQVTSFHGHANCTVNGWGSDVVLIDCFDSDGSPSNAEYSVAFYINE